MSKCVSTAGKYVIVVIKFYVKFIQINAQFVKIIHVKSIYLTVKNVIAPINKFALTIVLSNAIYVSLFSLLFVIRKNILS
jgi:hypothetical protein